MDPAAHWDARVAHFRSDRPASGAIVFLGDSLTEAFPLAQLLNRGDLVNRGVAMDHLRELGGRSAVLRATPELLAPEPRAIVVLLGINDLGDTPDDPEGVLAAYGSLLDRLEAGFPSTELFLQSLLPTRGRYDRLNSGVRATNTGLASLARERRCSFIDLHAALATGDGRLARLHSRDGLHLSRLGYRAWAHALAPLLPART